MQEKSWWSNNILAVVGGCVAILLLTAFTIVGLREVFDGFKTVVNSVDKQTAPDAGPQKSETSANKRSGTTTENSVSPGPFGPYMAKLQQDIKMHWYPPKGNENRRVTVLFNVDRKGNLHKLKVTPSGDEASDAAARRAIEKSAPFAPLPAGTKEPNVDIQFTFDYNVFNHKRHQ